MLRQKVLEKIRKLQTLNGALKGVVQGENPLDNPRHLKDPAYLLRGNPAFVEHDRNGFRNSSVSRHPEVLAVGDSQVYGACVKSEESWPFQLQSMLGKSVYNAGMEGWGAVQYAMIADELVSMNPSLLVVGLYTGNDIYESFLAAKQSVSPLAKSFWDNAYDGIPLPDLSIKRVSDRVVQQAMEKGANLTEGEILHSLSEQGVLDCTGCTLEGSRMYLTENFRYAVQDRSQPAIEAGFEIVEKALAYIQALADSYGFGLQVVLIPTREYLVYTRLADARLENAAGLLRLGETEQATLERLQQYCAANSMDCLDLSQHLTHYIGSRIYPQESRDGHPSAKGCRVIADHLNSVVCPALRRAEKNLYPLY